VADALHVATAAGFGAAVATLDRRLAAAATALAVSAVLAWSDISLTGTVRLIKSLAKQRARAR
jgi:hypothetical protein